MTTYGEKWTLLDHAKSLDPDGRIARVAEICTQKNHMLMDAYWEEANGKTHHRTTCRDGVPISSFASYNQGYTKRKATTVQVDEAIAMTRDVSEVDRDLAELGGNKNRTLLNQARPIIEGISQHWASKVIYSDADTDPKGFYGLQSRYNSLSAANARNVVSGGGSGSDLMSMYFINWGPAQVYMTYPEGSKAGLMIEGGQQVETIFDEDNNPMPGYRTYFSQRGGVVTEDWRHCVRACNIDYSELTGDKSGSSADLTELLSKMFHRIENIGPHAAIYANRDLNEYLALQINNTTNVNITREQTVRGPVTMIEGVPLRTMDALTKTETTVS